MQIDLNRESLASKLDGSTYDVVFCGEVIEHLFSPDALLRDVKTLMTHESVLVLSTPNLGYWVNRLLLLAGVSPLYLENSAETKLGRFTEASRTGEPDRGTHSALHLPCAARLRRPAWVRRGRDDGHVHLGVSRRTG